MTTFVSTLGFDTSHLQNLLVTEDVEDGDRLLIVRPDDDDSRGENAVKDVEGMVDMIDVGIMTDVRLFDPEGYEETTATLVELLDTAEDEVVVNLAGGDRALLIPLAVAAMSTTTEVRATHLRSDVTRESHEIQLPTVHPGLNDRDSDVLRYIVNNGPVSNTRIAAATEKSESTVYRSIETLKEMGYVSVENDGGSNSVEPTFVGKLMQRRL